MPQPVDEVHRTDELHEPHAPHTEEAGSDAVSADGEAPHAVPARVTGAAPGRLRLSREVIFGAFSFVLFIVILTVLIDSIGVSQIQRTIQSAGPLAPLAYIALKAVTYVVAPLSSGPIQLSAGILFGLWPGVIFTLVGEVIGGTVSFLIARYLGRPVVVRLVGAEGMGRVDHFYQNHMGGWKSLAFARLALFSVWDFLSYAAGLAPVRLRTYVLVSIICGALPTFFFVYLGTMLTMDRSALLLAYGLVAVAVVLPVAFRRPLLRFLQRLRG